MLFFILAMRPTPRGWLSQKPKLKMLMLLYTNLLALFIFIVFLESLRAKRVLSPKWDYSRRDLGGYVRLVSIISWSNHFSTFEFRRWNQDLLCPKWSFDKKSSHLCYGCKLNTKSYTGRFWVILMSLLDSSNSGWVTKVGFEVLWVSGCEGRALIGRPLTINKSKFRDWSS